MLIVGFTESTFTDSMLLAPLVLPATSLAVCAEDVFVHHFGQATFGDLVPTGEYSRLLNANKHRFTTKWGKEWTPHQRRRDGSYVELIERIKNIAEKIVPEGSKVLVVSRGDQSLLECVGPCAHHFPQDDGGGYAGHYPANSDAAITQLEELRVQGAQFLLFPATAFWWLEHYSEFRIFLENSFQQLVFVFLL